MADNLISVVEGIADASALGSDISSATAATVASRVISPPGVPGDTAEEQYGLEGKRTLTSTIPLNPNVPHIPRTVKTATTTPNKPTLHPTAGTRRSRQPTTIPVKPAKKKTATAGKTKTDAFPTDDRRLVVRQRIGRHLQSQITAHSTEP